MLGLTPAIVANRLTVFEVREYMRIRIAAIEQRGRDEIESTSPLVSGTLPPPEDEAKKKKMGIVQLIGKMRLVTVSRYLSKLNANAIEIVRPESSPESSQHGGGGHPTVKAVRQTMLASLLHATRQSGLLDGKALNEITSLASWAKMAQAKLFVSYRDVLFRHNIVPYSEWRETEAEKKERSIGTMIKLRVAVSLATMREKANAEDLLSKAVDGVPTELQLEWLKALPPARNAVGAKEVTAILALLQKIVRIAIGLKTPSDVSQIAESVDDLRILLEGWSYPQAFQPAMRSTSDISQHDPIRLAFEVRQEYPFMQRLGVPQPPIGSAASSKAIAKWVTAAQPAAPGTQTEKRYSLWGSEEDVESATAPAGAPSDSPRGSAGGWRGLPDLDALLSLPAAQRSRVLSALTAGGAMRGLRRRYLRFAQQVAALLPSDIEDEEELSAEGVGDRSCRDERARIGGGPHNRRAAAIAIAAG